MQLYKSLLRSHLKYSVHFWSPAIDKNVIKLERMRKRFTSILLGHAGLSYRKLDWVALYSLACRKLRDGLTEGHRAMDKVNAQSFLQDRGLYN